MANLLEQASILLTPTAYNNGSMLAVKPETTLGDELILNGGFDTDSDWNVTSGSNANISNGKANYIDASQGQRVQQNIDSLSAGKKYNVIFEISNYVSGEIGLFIGGDYAANDVTSNGVYTFTHTVVSGNELFFRAMSGNTSLSIDNVSIKEDLSGDFTFSRNSAATRVNAQGFVENVQILSSNLVSNGDFSQEGSELVTNGNFTNGSANWILGGSGSNIATIGSNSATITSVDGNSYIQQNSVLTSGKSYKISYEILSSSGSSVLKMISSLGLATVPTTVGTHTVYGTATTTTFYIERTSNGMSASITNISVKEVGQNWDLGGTATIGDNLVNINSPSGENAEVYQSSVLVIGRKYKLDCTLNKTSGDTQFVNGGTFILNNGSNVIQFTATDTRVYFKRGAGSVISSITNISVIEITDDTNLPRIDYTDGCGSWLLEPQSTNLVITSDSGDYGSSPGSEILETSPDGTNNAVRPVPSTGSNRYQKNIAGGVYSSGQKLTYSWYRKRISTPVDDTFVGDLRINVLVNITVFEATTQIQSNINGYDRFQVVIQITDGSLSSTFRAYFGAIIGTGNSSVAYWGHQYEIGGYATSIIPTSGAITTRLADIATNSGNASLMNSSEGVLYAEISTSTDSTDKTISISDGSSSNRIWLGYSTQDKKVYALGYSGGSVEFALSKDLEDETKFLKVAVSYKENYFSLWVDGVQEGLDTSGLTPVGLNKLQFNLGNGGGLFYGKNKALAVFKTALTDAQLTALTTI